MDSQTAAGQPGLGRGHETLPKRCGRPAAAQPALLADMARNPSVHDLIRQGTLNCLTPESSNNPPRQLDFLSFGDRAISRGISRAA